MMSIYGEQVKTEQLNSLLHVGKIRKLGAGVVEEISILIIVNHLT